jgi:hypothetical protein
MRCLKSLGNSFIVHICWVLRVLTFHREKLSVELESTGKITIDVPGVGSQVELTPDLIVIEKRTRTERFRSFTPNVIEPSFGVSHFRSSALYGRAFLVSFFGLTEETRSAAYSMRFASTSTGPAKAKATRVAPYFPSHPPSHQFPSFSTPSRHTRI